MRIQIRIQLRQMKSKWHNIQLSSPFFFVYLLNPQKNGLIRITWPPAWCLDVYKHTYIHLVYKKIVNKGKTHFLRGCIRNQDSHFCTMCQRNVAPFYKVSYYIKWAPTSWTNSMLSRKILFFFWKNFMKMKIGEL